MDDSANTQAAGEQPAAEESTLTKIEHWVEHLGQEVVDKVEILGETIEDDVWPYVRDGIFKLISQVGQAAIRTALPLLPTLGTPGGFAAVGAAVGTAVVAEVVKEGPNDLATVVSQIQAGLQAVKGATGMQNAGDAPTVDAVKAVLPQASAGENGGESTDTQEQPKE